ncbi:HTTM domain-containing protein [Saccharothrix australiensis]|uniref:Antimicrobial peptide system SdpB family protein n=1 Tax=Saccharothrix australiensis TaxID=2072 RepID=A0A495W1Q7_9PSEU|nr:HTTM domain-containing protein [Saccharothrix australiensis]RKT54653.1 antimicrobial peptide system SdpB family protein [Saccharothrix australiensis]
MPVVIGAAALTRAVARFEPRGAGLSVGRALLAAAQLAVLVFNQDADLFVATREHPTGVDCGGVRAAALPCATADAPLVGRIAAVAVLLVVASGYRPRWTCVPHWYVTAGLAMTMPMANGGDKIAQIATMLLVPLCLGDDRVWQWGPVVRPLAANWRGVAFAALVVLRGQLCLVYAYAGLSKLGDPLWRQGSAMSVVFADPYFGLAREVHDLVAPALSWYWPMALLGWSVIAAQLVIAVAVLGGPRARALAFALGLCLHLGIALLMNLPLFTLAVLGMLVVGCAPTRRWDAGSGVLERAR